MKQGKEKITKERQRNIGNHELIKDKIIEEEEKKKRMEKEMAELEIEEREIFIRLQKTQEQQEGACL